MRAGIVAAILITCNTLAAELPQAEDHSPATQRVPGSPADAGAGVTNQVSLEQLATKLQELHQIVEEALPALTEFNQQAGNTNAMVGAISGIISGLKRDPTNSAAGNSSGQRLTNILSALGALVSTNKQGAPELDSTTLKRLAALEKDLRPIAEAMRQLNLAGTNSADRPPGSLTPTGRR